MTKLRQIVGIVLLVLWVPMTSHCTWENFSGLQFLKCATEAPENNDQCNDDACSQLESATYKISETHADFLPPAFTSLVTLLILVPCHSEHRAAVIFSPPELSTSWQFSFRAALPPRAPSFVS